ncbi:MAG: hypothetical protein E7773_05945 [Sphingomonas sp.]|uniref:DUF2268 domain-containing putative Zn-dependent protease n=1 Tax=Sphingomonas sp. TaxID=28214 RepID=UPI001208F431|nr:DUF2268 domain-containing putative Zn-dependent protease [Sphingomonas sp.]THD36552.1 MAG: hypothetical protein E7773_05945 [Sphingomonas sp.]
MRRLTAAALIVLDAAMLTGAAKQPPAPYHSLTREFAQFYDSTVAMPEAARVALFRQRFAARFPGFYAPADGQSDEQFNRNIAASLRNFPALRARYEQTERDFPRAYAAGLRHFRAQFPGFKPVLPVWFVHSLGRMDGGTRTYGGKTYMVFGADVIAQIHGDGTIGPFLDHELFHVENGQWFKDCQPDTTVWCSLWQEGGATYAASVMNPGADDHTLMLDLPKPIRPAVDAKWQAALCTLRRDLDKGDQATYASYFMGGGGEQAFPKRWGYYVGYRLMQRVGKRHSLAQIDHMGHAAARAEIDRELGGMIAEAGGCPA